MAERKRISGDSDKGAALLGLARAMLAQLRAEMSVNRLMIGKRTMDFDGGVTITVSSVFGQDEVQIFAPDAIAEETREEALVRLGADPEFFVRKAANNDTVTTSDMVTLTVTIYDIIDIAPGAPGSGTNDIVYVSSSVKLTIVNTVQPAPYVPPPAPPQIFIGGTDTGNGDPLIWDDVNGLRRLGLRNGVGQSERSGVVYGFSPNGQIPVGTIVVTRAVTAYSAAQGKGAFGSQYGAPMAACWRNGTADADTPTYVVDDISDGTAIDAGGTVRGSLSRNGVSSNGFTWDGRGNHSLNPTASYPAKSKTSSNSRLKVQGNKYQLDNGPWITWGNQYADGQAALHIPYTPPTPPDQSPTVTTITMVFSG